MATVEARELSKRFDGGNAIDAINLSVREAEFLVLLGPSGSGKTTLLRMIAGLETPTSGDILVDDHVVTDLPPRARNMAMVFQSYALYPHLTVFENIAFPLQAQGMHKQALATRVDWSANLFGIGHLLKRKPRQLSGGERQRVALARAVVREPVVFLLDEPLSNLDAKLREEARAFLRELILRLGLSAIMVTHDQNEAMAISDRILLLNNGKIEQQGTPQEMYGSPHSLFCAEFMGSNNILQGTVSEISNGQAVVQGQGWQLRGKAGEGLQQGQNASAIIRVEQVKLGTSTSENSVQLPLLTSMYLGDKWEYLFRAHGADAQDAFVVRAYGMQERVPGQCHLELPAEHVWVFPS